MCLFLISVLLLCGFTTQLSIKKAVPTFQQGHIHGHVTANGITEASGLAASRLHPGYLYTHNDRNGKQEIYVISAINGHLVATLTLHGATANDWEDIAVGPCSPGATDTCIYVAVDLGGHDNININTARESAYLTSDNGNGGGHAFNNIYRLREPANLRDQTITIPAADTLMFSWDREDSETLMVDPDANLYIVSKKDNANSYISKLPSSMFGTGTRQHVSSDHKINIVSHKHDPVGGDISPDGSEMLIKAKEDVFYWSMGASRDYVTMLTTPGTPLPYTLETRGESVCWDNRGSGYYTLGEGNNEPLYYYSRSGTGQPIGR